MMLGTKAAVIHVDTVQPGEGIRKVKRRKDGRAYFVLWCI